MTTETEDGPVRVLDEDDGVELLAYLVTAARTQTDEAAEYAPMRLLTAAGRLAEMIEPNASASLRPLLRDVRQGCSETAVQASDPAGYVERLDGLCRTVAAYLCARWAWTRRRERRRAPRDPHPPRRAGPDRCPYRARSAPNRSR